MSGLDDVVIVQKLSALSERSSLVERDVDGLKTSNTKRKQENLTVGEKLNSMQSQIGSMDAVLRGQAKSIEAFHDDMKELSHDTKETSIAVAKLTGIVEGLDKKAFNWYKFWSGVVSPKGMILTIFGITSFTIIILAILSPENLTPFFELMKSKKF